MKPLCLKFISGICAMVIIGITGALLAPPLVWCFSSERTYSHADDFSHPSTPSFSPHCQGGVGGGQGRNKMGFLGKTEAPKLGASVPFPSFFAALIGLEPSTNAVAGASESKPSPEEKKPAEVDQLKQGSYFTSETVKEKRPSELDHPKPEIPPGTHFAPYDHKAFSPDPSYKDKPYSAEDQVQIYGGKHANPTERPMLELGRELYREGPFQPAATWWGTKNLMFPHFYTYGDWRTAAAYNDNGKQERGVAATRLNLDVDLQLTSTERIHAFFRPLDHNGEFTRTDLSGPNKKSKIEFNQDPGALFFEGDMGRIVSGITDQDNRLDLPFAFGRMPILFQNGIWVQDAFEGVAFTIPARNSPNLDISNADITFFAGVDEVTSGAIRDAKNKLIQDNARIYGFNAFVETMNGYWEGGYGYTDAFKNADGLSYHNLTAAFTRRYFDFLSNTVRAIWNVGQNPKPGQQKTADGYIFLIENSFVTSDPNLIPYLNVFTGVNRPQSLARAADAGGVLQNTGILFEGDGLTGYPTMDDTGNGTYGAAFGMEYLFNLDQQIVFETAALDTFGDPNEVGRPAKGRQFGLGIRYQFPISNSWILRADSMHAWRFNDKDLTGFRVEIRHKF